MKKFLVCMILLVFVSPAYSSDAVCGTSSKCTDLVLNMRKSREVISNVLNLTDDQRKCKRTIDEKFKQDVSSDIDLDKEIISIDEYDKEFKLILTKKQKSKLNSIRKMEKSALKACKRNKVYYKPDENWKPFGVK